MKETLKNCEDVSGIIPCDFEEQIAFSKNIPYRIRKKQFYEEDIVPLHYAETIEILLCDSLKGNIVIDNNQYEFNGKQVFIIPPYTVHSNQIYKCNGVMYIFKTDFDGLSQYINIKNIYESENKTLSQLSYSCPEYDNIYRLIERIKAYNDNLPFCITYILELFNILFQYIDKDRISTELTANTDSLNLRDLINWTQNNFSHTIKIDDIASIFGYSKYYFCYLFKKMTGITYLNYLNNVRISHACRMLRDGKTVKEVSEGCGFNDVSYFVQVFKKIHGITPKQYSVKTNVINSYRPE